MLARILILLLLLIAPAELHAQNTAPGTNGQILFNNAGKFGAETSVPIANGGTGSTTSQGALNNLNAAVSPVVSAAYTVVACKGFDDQNEFATAETVAYVTKTAMLVPPGSEYGPSVSCNFNGQWKLSHLVVAVFGWPRGSIYGNDVSFGGIAPTIHLSTGSIGGNKCFIDTNGADNLSVSFLNFNGDSPAVGAVTFCNSYSGSPKGQDGSLNLLNVSNQDMGNFVGCAVDHTTGACTGTLGNQDILVRAEGITVNQGDWAFNGNLTDMFLTHFQFAGLGMGAVSLGPSGGFAFVGGMRMVAGRIEYCGGSASQVWGSVNLNGNGDTMNSIVGVQFDHNAGADIKFTNAAGYVEVVGSFFYEGAHSQTANQDGSIIFANTVAGGGHIIFTGNMWKIGQVQTPGVYTPKYIARFDGTTDDYIAFVGNSTGPINSGYTVAPYIFNTETPTHFEWNNMGDPKIEIGTTHAYGKVTAPLSSFDLSGYTDGLDLPSGTTAQRPSASNGILRNNTDIGGPEIYDGGSWKPLISSVTPLSLSYPTLSNDGTTPNTIIDISTGGAPDDSGQIQLSLTSVFTKTTGSFTAGTGNGCLDTGSVANSTQYNLFLISTGTSTDALCSTSMIVPILPAGYFYKTYIGSFFTDGSAHIKTFSQVADTVYPSAGQVLDVSSVTIGTTAALQTLSTVPVGVKVAPLCNYTFTNTGHSLLLSSPDEADQLPTDTIPYSASPGFSGLDLSHAAGIVNANCPDMITDTQARIRARASAASTTLSITTRGWTYIRNQRPIYEVIQAGTTTYTLKPSWNVSENVIIGIGEGGSGGTGGFGSGSGGGGCYAQKNNLSDAPGTVEAVQIGAGGTSTTTQFKNNTTVVASFGVNASGQTAGAGCSTGSSVGDIKFAGGAGKNGGAFSAPGGGGGGGQNGAGGDGSIAVNNDGGGGGGGANGGQNGTAPVTAGIGGIGGTGPTLTGACSPGSTLIAATTPSLGSGGCGGSHTGFKVPSQGSIYQLFATGYGPAGGSGGPGTGAISGVNGFGWGAGASGGSYNGGAAGIGAPGGIIIGWMPK